jgi:hypothetical protein
MSISRDKLRCGRAQSLPFLLARWLEPDALPVVPFRGRANILDVHCCDEGCIKPSRQPSRRWQRYLAEWAKESKDAA